MGWGPRAGAWDDCSLIPWFSFAGPVAPMPRAHGPRCAILASPSFSLCPAHLGNDPPAASLPLSPPSLPFRNEPAYRALMGGLTAAFAAASQDVIALEARAGSGGQWSGSGRKSG